MSENSPYTVVVAFVDQKTNRLTKCSKVHQMKDNLQEHYIHLHTSQHSACNNTVAYSAVAKVELAY